MPAYLSEGFRRRELRVLRPGVLPRHFAAAAALAAGRNRCQSLPLGDDVGKIYAQKYFPPEAKAEAQAMVANIIAAFRKRIDALSWMDPKTKRKHKPS